MTASEAARSPVALRDRLESRDADAHFLSLTSAAGVERVAWGAFWSLVDGHAQTIERATAPGDFILIMSRTEIGAIACFFAAICSGRLVAFFPPPNRVQDEAFYRQQQSASIAKIAPDRIVTFDEASSALVREIGFGHAAFDPTPRAPGDGAAALQAFVGRLESFGPALFVQHSSGTTGIKKAVGITGPMLRAQYQSYWQGVIEPIAEQPKIASWLPLYHDMGLVATLLLPTIGAGELAFVDPFHWVESPQSLLNVIDRERSNLVWMPNFAFRHYVRIARLLRPRDLSSVRAWINCSEPCRAADADAFETRFADMGVGTGSIVGCYAMAEAVFAVTQGERGARKVLRVDAEQRAGDIVRTGEKAVLSSGAPIPGIEVALFADGVRVTDDRYGEIAIRGRCVFAGYKNMPAADSNIRPDGFFMSGDLGTIHDGELFVFGRQKEMIIVNGKNIFATDVESIVGAVSGLKAGRVVAFGVDNPASGSEDLVVVAERDGSERDTDEIVAEVTRRINAAFLISPHAVSLVAERWLAKTTSGKISRAENRAKYLKGLRC